MIQPEDLPAVNAVLNSSSALLVSAGYMAIKKGQVRLHKVCMLAAVAVSAIFLASYLYYHFVVRGGQPTRFTGVSFFMAFFLPAWDGWLRLAYFAILLSHTILAVAVAPLVLITVYLGLRDRIARHVRLARWTLPLWLYVSITGVVVYWMLYQM